MGGTTRWLNTEEQDTWRAFLAASQRVREALDRQLQRDAGMPHAYYQILATLSEADDRRTLTMTELARRTRSSPSRLSHAVARLESKGWVRRGRDRADHRTTLATLTECGMEKLRQTAPGHVTEARSALFDHLTRDQVGQLGEICRAVVDAAERQPDTGPCPDAGEDDCEEAADHPAPAARAGGAEPGRAEGGGAGGGTGGCAGGCAGAGGTAAASAALPSVPVRSVAVVSGADGGCRGGAGGTGGAGGAGGAGSAGSAGGAGSDGASGGACREAV